MVTVVVTKEVLGLPILRTSIQASSPISTVWSRDLLLPLTWCRLLGGARSSELLMAGLFLSSILTIGEVGRAAEGEVATGIREKSRQADRLNGRRAAVNQERNC